MSRFERAVSNLRHNRFLEDATWLWNWLRPIYERALILTNKSGLKRTINGLDPLLIDPRFRQIRDEYEPEMWKLMMSKVEEGDVIVDVGAFIGLYTVALAMRVGPSGKIIALEPDPENFSALLTHLDLNHVAPRTQCIQKALGRQSGRVGFAAGRSSESAVVSHSGESIDVEMTSLDDLLQVESVDVIKIDVEGHERDVLLGGLGLLRDPRRRPDFIFMELHQFAWSDPSNTAKEIQETLTSTGYRLLDVDENPVGDLRKVGWLVATAG